MSDEYDWLRVQGYTDEMLSLHKMLVKAMLANPEFQRINAEQDAQIIAAFEATPLVVIP